MRASWRGLRRRAMVRVLGLRSGLRSRARGQLRQARQALIDLRESERRYRLLAENATDMIVRLNLEGVRTYVSPASITVLGYPPEALVGISTYAFVHPDDEQMVRDRLRRVMAGEGDQRGFNRVIRADGRVAWVEVNVRLVRHPVSGAPHELVSVVRDVTEQQETARRIHILARTDQLTGLANRYVFLDTMAEWLQAEAAFSVLFIDLDNFKPINDLHGHAAGDELLQRIGARLILYAPEGVLPARLGGDEFALLLPAGCDTTSIANLMLDIVSMPIAIAGTLVMVGASIGVARCPEDGRDETALLRAADMAMYDAKRTGRGLAGDRQVGRQGITSRSIDPLHPRARAG